MKKIILYVFLCVTVLGSLAGCGDNEDVSIAHFLTDDEVAELRRQDSIDSVNRTKVNADLVLEYNVQFPAHSAESNDYTGMEVEIDTTAIAELFGITCEELRLAIWNFWDYGYDAPKLTPFVIEGDTRNDDFNPSSTGAPFGSWLTFAGRVTNWGVNSYFFIEYYPNEHICHVGQFPGMLEPGQTTTLILGLKYQDFRVAIKFNVTITETEKLNIDIIKNFEATPVVQQPVYSEDYAYPTFDQTAVAQALGVTDWCSEVEMFGIKSDGSFYDFKTAYMGYYYDMQGNACGSGDTPAIAIDYWGLDAANLVDYPEDINCFYVSQAGNFMEDGLKIAPKFGFYNKSTKKGVTVTVNFEVVPYNDPETAPAGEPTTDSVIDVVIEKAWTSDYANVTTSIKDALRNAFKMTTNEIYLAKRKGEITITCKNNPHAIDGYTADVPGYWLTIGGDVCYWGENTDMKTLSAVFCCMGATREDLWLYAGNFPDKAYCPENSEVKTTYLISCNGGTLTANVTIKVGEAVAQ